MAARRVTTTRLRVNRLAVVLAQPRRERLEGILDVIGRALGVRTTVVRVKVLVDIKDDVIGSACRPPFLSRLSFQPRSLQFKKPTIGVLHTQKRRTCLSRQRLRRGEAASRDQDHTRRCDLANRRDGGLHGGHPGVERREVVRLVHEPEDNLAVAAVLGGKLRPERHEVVGGGPTGGADHLTVVAGVVAEV